MKPTKKPGALAIVVEGARPPSSPTATAPKMGGPDREMQYTAAGEFAAAVRTGDPARIWDAFEAMSELCSAYPSE